MKAVKYIGGKVAVLDVPAPTGPGIRVKITSVGICGSDLAMLDSGFDIAGIPGHEMAGVLADGTPVAIEPVIPCGTCEFCRAGHYQVCRSGVERIFGVGRNGGMAKLAEITIRKVDGHLMVFAQAGAGGDGGNGGQGGRACLAGAQSYRIGDSRLYGRRRPVHVASGLKVPQLDLEHLGRLLVQLVGGRSDRG